MERTAIDYALSSAPCPDAEACAKRPPVLTMHTSSNELDRLLRDPDIFHPVPDAP